MRRILSLLLPLAIGFAILAADTVYFYTKKRETALLDAPRSRQAPVAKLDFREKLELLERDGSWLKVKAPAATGWVYEGNVADREPPSDRSFEGLPTTASPTSDTIAARPLTPVAKEYAAQKGKREASEDVLWMSEQSDRVSKETVLKFLEEGKKGEFQ